MMWTSDRNKKSPKGIEPITSRTRGGRSIHRVTRTPKEHGYQLFDAVTTGTFEKEAPDPFNNEITLACGAGFLHQKPFSTTQSYVNNKEFL